jgi:ornithine carbamoyltransferase
MEQVPGEEPDYDAGVTRHFLTGAELTGAELDSLLDRALELKAERLGAQAPGGGEAGALEGRSVALLFEQPSTRTRVSFEVGVAELGGTPVLLRGDELQLRRGESTRDTAIVLSRFVHMIGVRTGAHAPLEELAEHGTVPIVNMLTRDHHPCQALADLLTLRERFGSLDGLRLAYVGDGNNVAVSLMVLGAKAGVDVVVAAPSRLAPPPEAVALAQSGAEGSGRATVVTDPREAAEGAHAVYTDVWVSMGDDDGEAATRRAALAPYRLDDALLDAAREDAIALHCLPAHPGEEITAEVLYGQRSAVWDQAENRLHAQKALMELLVAG